MNLTNLKTPRDNYDLIRKMKVSDSEKHKNSPPPRGFLVLLLTGQPAWAASATLWQIPGSLSLDEAGFRLEAPANISDRAVKVSVEALDSSKTPHRRLFYNPCRQH